MPLDQDFSFRSFAQHTFYGKVNLDLLEQAGIGPGQRVVELACGTGAVTRLILERLRGAKESLVIAIDHSALAIKQAMEELKNVRASAVQFIQSKAEELPKVVQGRVDAVIFCNGIHYIPDKETLVERVSQTLKPGGTFAFNTSFFQGAQPPETQQFYRRWMLKALRILKEKHGLSLPHGQKVEARRYLTPEQYVALVEGHSLQLKGKEVKEVPVPLEAWLDISSYQDFIEGILPGLPLSIARQVLQEGVTRTFEELGIQSVPRNWLAIVAVKA
ncbi:MAG: methyltransferase domain-containing protein [Chloroflexi bacterium]|nr:methyltransferase domain-containing protein [Chloroflexota bacterium]